MSFFGGSFFGGEFFSVAQARSFGGGPFYRRYGYDKSYDEIREQIDSVAEPVTEPVNEYVAENPTIDGVRRYIAPVYIMPTYVTPSYVASVEPEDDLMQIFLLLGD